MSVSAVSSRRRAMRQEPRSSVVAEVRNAMGLGPSLTAQFLDLSEGGLRVVLKKAVRAGQEVEVILQGCGMSKPIKQTGHVTWTIPLEDGKCCVGIEFAKRLTSRDAAALSRPR